MRALQREEVVPLAPYARIRHDYRRTVIAHKRARRVEVGPSVALIFEDRETLRFQVQEMLFVERVSAPEPVQHELDVYNELMPGPGELSATLMVQITEPGRIRAELDRLIGIDEHVALVLGEGDGAERIRARFDPKQFEEERISAVQYIRFALDDVQAARFADPDVPARFEIDHPGYSHASPLASEIRESLALGLTREPASLLPDWDGAPEPEVVYESASARILSGEGGLCVESRAEFAAFDDAAWNDFCETLRRALTASIEETGGAQFASEPLDETSAVRVRVVGRRARRSKTG